MLSNCGEVQRITYCKCSKYCKIKQQDLWPNVMYLQVRKNYYFNVDGWASSSWWSTTPWYWYTKQSQNRSQSSCMKLCQKASVIEQGHLLQDQFCSTNHLQETSLKNHLSTNLQECGTVYHPISGKLSLYWNSNGNLSLGSWRTFLSSL